MPEILIVAATPFEVKGLCEHYHIPVTSETGLFSAGPLSVLITGVGMINTAWFMGKYGTDRYDYLINAGVCGAFSRTLAIGELVCVNSDTVSELGAEDDQSFIKYPDLDLGGINTYFPKINRALKILSPLKEVKAITLNKVHGNENSIQKTQSLYSPDVESMEGAAFLRGCEGLHGHYFQLRTVSNYVEKRDKSKWDMPLAIGRLNTFLIQLINEIQA